MLGLGIEEMETMQFTYKDAAVIFGRTAARFIYPFVFADRVDLFIAMIFSCSVGDGFLRPLPRRLFPGGGVGGGCSLSIQSQWKGVYVEVC